MTALSLALLGATLWAAYDAGWRTSDIIGCLVMAGVALLHNSGSAF